MFGAPQEILEAVDGHDDRFELWEENLETVAMFCRLQSQWVANMGGISGLNYQSVDFLFTIYGVEDRKQMFEDLQAMEFAALPILNKRD